MARPKAKEPRARSVGLTQVALGAEEPRLLPRPVRVRLAGPYEDGLYLAACPELGLACTGISPEHVLGQVEGTIALALATKGRGLNSEGRRLAHLLGHPAEPGVVPLGAHPCLYCGTVVPRAANGHVRRYCNASCRKRDAWAKGLYGEERACAICEQVFHVKRRSEPTRTCSAACAGLLRRGPRRRRGG